MTHTHIQGLLKYKGPVVPDRPCFFIIRFSRQEYVYLIIPT